jgi:hypothetical protein
MFPSSAFEHGRETDHPAVAPLDDELIRLRRRRLNVLDWREGRSDGVLSLHAAGDPRGFFTVIDPPQDRGNFSGNNFRKPPRA